MRTLSRKLFRDLWALRGQSLAIIAVVATGVAMVAMYLSTFDSLDRMRSEFYERQRFGHVFASCKRAPQMLAERLAETPGVTAVETRIVVDVSLDLDTLASPARARLLSIPESRRDVVNDLVIQLGRYPEPGATVEVLVHERFAAEHSLVPGDSVRAVINGRLRELRIAGTALSPEFVYVIGPGDMIPDPQRYGVFWMPRGALAAAFDMEGAFNDLTLRWSPSIVAGSPEARLILAEVDRQLDRYGGHGAIERAHQTSHWFVSNELDELRTMASIVPTIFLAVAAFLVNIVLSRMIALHRTQIAVLKAVGYSSREVSSHYLGLAVVISLIGALIGSALGAWLGSGLTRIYFEYFRFPEFLFGLRPAVAIGASAVGTAAAAFGAIGAVRRASTLPPAEAMRPEPPPRFERTGIERLGFERVLGPGGRMTLRNLARRPWRFLLSACGVGLAIGLIILGSFFVDALDSMMDLHFDVAQPHDMTITFEGPRSTRSRHELTRLPGVATADAFRAVPVRLSNALRSRRASLLGLDEEADLIRIVDRKRGRLPVPDEGLVVSVGLARILEVRVGDEIQVEFLTGQRREARVPVVEVVDDFFGLAAYMRRDALGRLVGDADAYSGAVLVVDPAREASLYERLKRTPGIAGVALTRAALESLRETVRANILRITAFNLLFAAVIAIGVVYNAARISLSEHARDLASLRVLGLTRAEVSSVLLRELAAITLLAIPIGILSGGALSWLLLTLLRNELYRVPLIISPRTYGIAILTVLTASLLSGLIVRRRVDRLDLIRVLKTRE